MTKKAIVDKTADTLAWTKTVAPKCTISHCILHHQTLIVKQDKRKRPPVSLKNVLHKNVNINFTNINILVTKWEIHSKHFHSTPNVAVLRNNAYALVWPVYLADIFLRMNNVTLSLQGTNFRCSVKKKKNLRLPENAIKRFLLFPTTYLFKAGLSPYTSILVIKTNNGMQKQWEFTCLLLSDIKAICKV